MTTNNSIKVNPGFIHLIVTIYDWKYKSVIPVCRDKSFTSVQKRFNVVLRILSLLKNPPYGRNYIIKATGQGLEPRLTGPEPVVLPLDEPVI